MTTIRYQNAYKEVLEIIKSLPKKDFEKIPKEKMQIVYCTPGSDPKLLINDNPKDPWVSDTSNAEIVIDLGLLTNVCGIGYWPHEISRDDPNISEPQYGARFLSGYEFYVSCDGENYTLVGDGTMLCHGGEQLVRFDALKAKFVKLKLLSSAGSVSHKPRYKDTPVMVGEFDIYSA